MAGRLSYYILTESLQLIMQDLFILAFDKSKEISHIVKTKRTYANWLIGFIMPLKYQAIMPLFAFHQLVEFVQ